jgi:hypothetical protein
MTTRFTVTISTGTGDGETRSSERANIKTMLEKVVTAVGDGTSTSGTIKDNAGNASTTWAYTPTASA